MTGVLLMVYLTGAGLTRKTLPVLAAHSQIGVLTTQRSYVPSLVSPFRLWAADNGCFNPQVSASFSLPAYLAWLDRFGNLRERCAFATAPDVLSDAAATWERSRPAFPAIRAHGYKAALVLQNGFEDLDVAWDEFDAAFIGGDTEWKLSRAAHSAVSEAKRRGKWVHMGRVNSLKRLEIAADFGCDSVDGNYLAFGPDTNLPKLLRWLDACQPRLWSAA